MIPLGLAREEPIDGFEALDIERRDIRPGHGAVVCRDGVDPDVQRVMPARAQVLLLPRPHGDHQQDQQQDQDAHHPESAAPRYGVAGRSVAARRGSFLAELRDAVHLMRADLDLDRLTGVRDDRRVERLVAVRLRHRDVVLEAARHRLPQ